MRGKTLKAAFELTSPLTTGRHELFLRRALYSDDFLGDGLSAESERYCQSARIEPLGDVTPDAVSLAGPALPPEPSLCSEPVDKGSPWMFSTSSTNTGKFNFSMGSRPHKQSGRQAYLKQLSRLAPPGCPVTAPDTLCERRCLEAFVVPGSRLLGIDGKSNPGIEARCRCIAKEFFQGTGQDQKVVVLIGGPVVVGRNAPSEALVMRKIVKELGVPDGQIYTEPAARNTFESAAIAKSILMQLCVRIVRVVAIDVHMKRALMVFERILGPDFTVLPCFDPWTFTSEKERQAEEKKEQYLLNHFENHYFKEKHRIT